MPGVARTIVRPKLTADTFQNVSLRLGLGADNAFSAASYRVNYLSRNRQRLEAMYRGNWLVGVAVDAVAEDMTRGGIDYVTELTPEQINELRYRGEARLNVWGVLCETTKWARLYGGALAVMVIDGQDMSQPLRHETIDVGSLKGFVVLDRWMVNPSFGELVQDIGPELGQPAHYQVVADAPVLRAQWVHHSRVLRIEGVRLPWYQRYGENLWGQSVMERVYDRQVAYDSATAGAAQLVHKAHLRTLKIEQLREVIAAGGKAKDAVFAQIDLIRKFQSAEGLTLLDASDDMQVDSYSFTGLSELLLQFGQQFSGALGIPLVRLFGQSPAGMNSTGDSDWENYYSSILQQQESQLRWPLTKLMAAMIPSILGIPVPDGFDFKFTPLWQMKPAERADIAAKRTSAVLQGYESGIVPAKVAMEELNAISEETGMWSNVTQDVIDAAEQEPPVMTEGEVGNDQSPLDAESILRAVA